MENRIISGNRSDMGARNVSPAKSGSEDIILGSPVINSTEPTIAVASLPRGNEQEIIQQLEVAIRAVQGPEKSFEISVHKETRAVMVKVFDKQTGDLIREIPSEKILDVAANMMKLIGLIVDERV
ncbi:flagellar protein FlaG [Paenibacillus sp. DS2015]|uniref:flagellar protein FlaG n=1 Tax=Paenibacillus sp. DS2015 TaxID=3373917 RepID=UPI003D244066